MCVTCEEYKQKQNDKRVVVRGLLQAIIIPDLIHIIFEYEPIYAVYWQDPLYQNKIYDSRDRSSDPGLPMVLATTYLQHKVRPQQTECLLMDAIQSHHIRYHERLLYNDDARDYLVQDLNLVTAKFLQDYVICQVGNHRTGFNLVWSMEVPTNMFWLSERASIDSPPLYDFVRVRADIYIRAYRFRHTESYFTTSIGISTTVAKIKEKLEKETNLQWKSMCVYFGDLSILDDSKTLIQNMNTIAVIDFTSSVSLTFDYPPTCRIL